MVKKWRGGKSSGKSAAAGGIRRFFPNFPYRREKYEKRPQKERVG
jgi:hypothetical protein